MNTINLLPYELRPIKRTPLPYILSGFVLAIVLVVIGITYLSNQGAIRTARNELNQHKQALAQLQPVVDEFNQLNEQKQQLATQVEIINEIAADRIIWSRQLYNLSRLSLENSWYQRIQVSTKTFVETERVQNPQTGEVELQSRQVPRQVLTISGYILPGEEGQSRTSPLIQNFQQDEEFSNIFQLDLPTLVDTEYEGVAVREFTLEYIINPGDRSDA